MVSKTDKIATMLLEQYDLKEELDSITKFVRCIEDDLVYYFDGEIITRTEWVKRTMRQIEILDFVLEKARKTTLKKERKLLKNLETIKGWYYEGK